MLDAKIAFAKRAAQGKTQQTLGDLEQQQQQHLNELVSGLIKQQRAMLDNIRTQLQSTDTGENNVLQQTGLQDLLIKENLLSPVEAVIKRQRVYQKYLEPLLNHETKLKLISTEQTEIVSVEVEDEKT